MLLKAFFYQQLYYVLKSLDCKIDNKVRTINFINTLMAIYIKKGGILLLLTAIIKKTHQIWRVKSQ